MKKHSSLLIVLVLLGTAALAACGSPGPSGEPGNATQPDGQSTSVQSPASIPSQAILEEVSGDLWLRVFSPEEAVTDRPEYMVEGQAPQETVLSINNEILVVGEDQYFAVSIPLDEGPNLVEILASNTEGQEAYLELLVTYEPVQ